MSVTAFSAKVSAPVSGTDKSPRHLLPELGLSYLRPGRKREEANHYVKKIIKQLLFTPESNSTFGLDADSQQLSNWEKAYSIGRTAINLGVESVLIVDLSKSEAALDDVHIFMDEMDGSNAQLIVAAEAGAVSTASQAIKRMVLSVARVPVLLASDRSVGHLEDKGPILLPPGPIPKP